MNRRLLLLALTAALAACSLPAPAGRHAGLPLQGGQAPSAIATATSSPKAPSASPRLAEPTAIPVALAATASPGPAATPVLAAGSALDEKAQAIASGVDALLSSLARQGAFSGSVLVAQGDQVVLSQGYGLADREKGTPNTPGTRFRLGSVTKPFTAMAVLILQAEGKLNVQDRICTCIEDCPAAWQDITIHHLLTHTSGIADLTEQPDFDRRKATPSPPLQTIARFKDLPLGFRPGEEWRYSNSGYIVLGAIIEQVSGQSYEAFLQQHIFDPLEMSDTGYDHNRDDLAVGYADRSRKADYIDMSIPFAAGGLYSTVEDLYRWDRALTTDRLIPRELLDQMFTPQAPTREYGGAGYGYGWFIGKPFGRSWIGHAGGIEGFSAIDSWFPDDETYIILLMNQQDIGPFRILEQIQKIVFR